MLLNPDFALQLASEHRRRLTPSAAETARRQLRRRPGHPPKRDAITGRTIFRWIAPAARARRKGGK